MSLPESVDNFLNSLNTDSTRRAYRVDLRAFCQVICGEEDHSPASTQPSDICAFLRACVRNDDSVSTRRRRLSAVRAYFDYLQEHGHVSSNPARDGSVAIEAKQAKRAKENLTSGDVDQLIQSLDKDDRDLRDRALILTIVHGALRRREAAFLKVKDVRPIGRRWILDIQASPGRSGGYVKVTERVVQAIEEMKDAMDISEGSLWRSTSNQNRTEPMSPDGLYKAVRNAGQRAGIGPKITIDKLRRIGLRRAYQDGTGLQELCSRARLRSMESLVRHLDL